jgi:hypothetical protein
MRFTIGKKNITTLFITDMATRKFKRNTKGRFAKIARNTSGRFAKAARKASRKATRKAARK